MGNETAPQRRQYYKFALVTVGARIHGPAEANDLTGQMQFSRPHANPMGQSPNQLPQKLLILKYNRDIECHLHTNFIVLTSLK